MGSRSITRSTCADFGLQRPELTSLDNRFAATVRSMKTLSKTSVAFEVKEVHALFATQRLRLWRQIWGDEDRRGLGARHIVPQLEHRRSDVPRLATGLHFADQRVTLTGDVDVRHDIDSLVRRKRLVRNIQQLDRGGTRSSSARRAPAA